MKKINFKELRLKSISGKEMIVDAREAVADQIYGNMGGIKCKLLAEKIFKSEVCVFEDDEWKVFERTLDPEIEFFNAKLRDAIESNIIDE